MKKSYAGKMLAIGTAVLATLFFMGSAEPVPSLSFEG